MPVERSSNFLNISIWSFTDNGSWDITDSIDGIEMNSNASEIIQRCKISLTMHTDKIIESKIGTFKEKYAISIEVFDASQNSITCNISYTGYPLSYLDMDLFNMNYQDINYNKQKSLSFSIELLYESALHTFSTTHAVLENTTYDNVVSFMKSELNSCNCFPFKIDPADSIHGSKQFEYFFIPDMKKFELLQYIVSRGYTKQDNDYAIPSIGPQGYAIPRLKISSESRIIKTHIFPDIKGVKDFNEMFVTDFDIERFPKKYLNAGFINTVFQTSLFKTKYETPKYANPKVNSSILVKDLFNTARSRVHNSFDQFSSYNQIRSYYDKIRNVANIRLRTNTIKTFDWLYPGLYVIDIVFEGLMLHEYNGKWIIIATELSITRQGNEFVPYFDFFLIPYEI